MITHLLMVAGRPVTAFLGGISKNYHSNYISSGKTDIIVAEADEFDRSFLHLKPDIAVISSMDADHLDIYQSRAGMLESFAQFALQVKPGGSVIIRSDLEAELPVLPNALRYSANAPADTFVREMRVEDGKHRFIICINDREYPEVTLSVAGRHNVENALAAATVGKLCGLNPEDIVTGLNTYTGVSRRFDIRAVTLNRIYIDDYAHHPRELTAFIQSIKELFPGKKVTGIFQPHLYSRTRDFAEGFAKSLDLLDDVILLDIYPAREKPIPGISSETILELMKSSEKALVKREELLDILDRKRPEVVLTIGAGDIDLFVQPIEELIRNWE